ncbi:MAG: hypothetical protein INR65_17605 [Gluconacetobacter diazotrophicus]|nr:hypothetical protein [Gluconacetobacter diazotrophicus]
MPRPIRTLALIALLAGAAGLGGCDSDLASHTEVQDCNGNRYLVPGNRLSGNGEGKGACVLKNGVMPQPLQFD